MANGHCNIPLVYPENKPLATWVAVQRRQYRASKLLPSRKEQLEGIGFVFEFMNHPPKTVKSTSSKKNKSIEERWMKKYRDLEAFKEKYNHMNVKSKDENQRAYGLGFGTNERVTRGI